jgi:predicted TIM-barrel fold metal-dependent hydrolase
MKKSVADWPVLPPVDFDPPSNGEYCPWPPTELGRRRHELWRGLVEEKHRRLGISRRQFAESACGTAAWLFTLGQLTGCGGRGGTGSADASGYQIDAGALEDMAQARQLLMHDPFVFDVQTHISEIELQPFPPSTPPELVLDFLKRIFVQSQTTVACVSGVPATRSLGIGNVQAKTVVRELMNRLGGPRLLFHCNADPEAPGEPDYQAEAVRLYPGIAAWKVFPQQPDHGLDHPDVAPFMQRAIDLDVRVVAAHRGLSGNGNYVAPGSPRDIVRAARLYPAIKFLVYHSGWESANDENHPYTDAGDDTLGVDRLIKALRETGLGPGDNLYAELGGTWFNLMGDALAAGHVLGKLLAQLGPDRILWGTDSIFTGNPQAQVDAFWLFEMPPALRDLYPPLTREVKRKILGLNGAAVYRIDPTARRHAITDDEVDRLRTAYLDDPRAIPVPHPRRHLGPRTRREFLAFLREEQRHRGG